MRENVKKDLRYILAFVAAILLSTIGEQGRLLNGTMIGSDGIKCFEGMELTCVIDLGSDMRGSHGHETGFSYEVLNHFAQDNGCRVKIITAADKGESYIDSLKQGAIDLLITHHEDTLWSNKDIIASDRINGCSVWVMNDNSSSLVQQINLWMHYFTESKTYRSLQSRFFINYDPIKRANKGVITTRVSPYDDLLKKYAAELGWDWRMLAAVAYQESKFSINAKSHRGAVGIMQVMPNTGKYYGIEDLSSPENNLMAGTRHLERIQKIFSNRGIKGEELVKFTLAAYNAGAGRIKDCQSLAEKHDYDASMWEEVTKVIPMMRENSILDEECVKLGKFQGFETIAYVDNVMTIYNAICTICPAI